MTDRFDRLCACAVISLTPEDIRQLEHCNSDYKQSWTRAKVNAGSRAVMADALCRSCGGTGEMPSVVAQAAE